MNSSHWPSELLVAEDAAKDPLTLRVIQRLNHLQPEFVSDHGDPLHLGKKKESAEEQAERFTAGKKKLLLCRYKGEWMRACPGTNSHVCCNLWTVNPGEGCPLDCTYCYLQSYLKRNPTLKIYSNIEDLIQAITDRVSSEPSRYFRIGTGEVIDSLVWDDLTDTSLELVPFFSRLPNAVLELKTKTANISNLVSEEMLSQGPRVTSNTVVSWSVNALEINSNDEKLTASFEQRLSAMEQVASVGYRVGLHFDPLIHFKGWEDAYSEAVRRIFSRLKDSDIAWISVSSLRYKPEMQEVMEERFPESSVPYGEQFLAKDGKMRYVQPLRLKMVNFVWNELKKVSNTLPVYMCMESSAAWRSINGGAPIAGEELKEVFARKARLKVLGDSDHRV